CSSVQPLMPAPLPSFASSMLYRCSGNSGTPRHTSSTSLLRHHVRPATSPRIRLRNAGIRFHTYRNGRSLLPRSCRTPFLHPCGGDVPDRIPVVVFPGGSAPPPVRRRRIRRRTAFAAPVLRVREVLRQPHLLQHDRPGIIHIPIA